MKSFATSLFEEMMDVKFINLTLRDASGAKWTEHPMTDWLTDSSLHVCLFVCLINRHLLMLHSRTLFTLWMTFRLRHQSKMAG